MNSHDYELLLASLKSRIVGAHQNATLAVNAEMIALYLHMGTEILLRQKRNGWGSKVVARLSADLQSIFPGIKGFSVSNLKYMKSFAEKCPDGQIGQQAADQLPWFHIVVLITKVRSTEHREWYARETLANGWSRAILEDKIKTEFRSRVGTAVSNFGDVAVRGGRVINAEILKDPYMFDFIGLANGAHERQIEDGLIGHLTQFLLELGTGFAFVGQQFKLIVGGDDFFIDLLLYHYRLKCFVVVELKAGEFKPEHVGQLNFYLNAVDAQLRARDDNLTIGLLLCKSKNKLVAEYSISGIQSPVGIAEYQLVRQLPERFGAQLPTTHQIESEMSAKSAKYPVTR
ncbi:MAG: PDDEXK nuclease domain-containing protein [Ilumatobacteraceae bacterium]